MSDEPSEHSGPSEHAGLSEHAALSRWRAVLVLASGLVAAAVLALLVVVGGGDDAAPTASGGPSGAPSSISPSSGAVSASPSTPAGTAGSSATPGPPDADAGASGQGPAGRKGVGSAAPSRPTQGSTADEVTNTPVAVARAFFDAALAGDCATAEDLVTENYRASSAPCRSTVDPQMSRVVDIEVGVGSREDDDGGVTVTVSTTVNGNTQDGVMRLVRVGGRWRIDGYVVS